MSLKTLISRLLHSSYSKYSSCLPYCAYHTQTTHTGLVKRESLKPILYSWMPSIHQQNTDKDFQNRLKPKAPINYILPSPCNGTSKKTIVDPFLFPHLYHLPTKTTLLTEKLSPAWKKIVPLEAPSKDSSTEKLASKYMIFVRRKKMKKHKLKRFRKRVMFLNRSLTQKKKRRKEKQLLMYEKEWLNKGEQFNAEAFVDKQIELAKIGSWSVDVISNWSPEHKGNKQNHVK